MTESATIDRFLEAMRSAGVQMNTGSAGGRHPIADGKIHRADSLDPRGKGKKHVWYVLHLDAPASGAFGDYKLGIQDTWTGGRDVKSLTPAERAAIKTRMEDARRQREEAAAAMAAKAAEVAAMIMTAENSAKADPEHPYLKRKGLPVLPGLRQLTRDVKYEIDPEDGPKVARKGALVVPMYHATADRPVLVGVQFIRTDGVKMFLKGTPKARAFHPIGKPPEEGADIFIAEGYATAARVHAAVGTRTFAAFDTGNLKPVVQVLAKKYPRSRFVFMADNDRFTTKPVDNPGVHFAREAAALVDGAVVVPHFLDGEEDKSDFDDLAQLRGLEAVRAAIDAVLNPQPEPPAFDEPPPHDSVPDYGESLPPLDDPNGPVDFSGANFHLETFGHPHFRCLGVDGLTCFYQPLDVAQVVSLTASAHKLENLQMLAPLQWWEAEFPAKKEGVDMKMAVNTLIRACKHKRKFVAHNAMRGRGAWFEGETPIFHAGDRLIVGGENKAIAEHSSRFVYDEGVPVPVDLHNPMTTAESRRFLDLCKSLRWQSPLSAYMLAGWCAIAPVCGFLKWRPHMWINGEAGAGKSTVMDKIVKVCLSTTAHSVVGNTTEAGIRGALGMDALPIIFDEAEPRDMESKNRLKSIMDLARVAASESDGLILKGTANQGTKGYRARSMFVFASINMQIEGYADESRFTQLTLVRPEGDLKSAGNKAHYEKLVSDIVSLMTPDFAQRLLARTIQHLPTLRRYVSVFTEAATLHLGTQRLGDQVGPMLAGAYLLNTSSDITVAGALEWIRSNDWTGMSARDATKDNDRFMQHVTGFLVRHNTPEGGTWERTIGELIDLSANAPEFLGTDFYESEPNKQKRAAVAALARLGIRVADDETAGRVVEFTTSYEGFRKSVLRNTEWSGTKYRDILKAIPGAVSGKANRYFSSGVNTPYVAVPLGAILQEQELKNL